MSASEWDYNYIPPRRRIQKPIRYINLVSSYIYNVPTVYYSIGHTESTIDSLDDLEKRLNSVFGPLSDQPNDQSKDPENLSLMFDLEENKANENTSDDSLDYEIIDVTDAISD